MASYVYQHSRGRLPGIAIPKKTIYAYGGRPVLYGDEGFRKRLDKKDQYLFCRFDSGADWTHEREWRVRPNLEINNTIGVNSNGEVFHYIFKDQSPNPDQSRYRGRDLDKLIPTNKLFPVHLPNFDKKGTVNQLSDTPQFILLVKEEADKEDCKEFIEKVVLQSTSVEEVYHLLYEQQVKEYRTKYLMALRTTNIISLDRVKSERDDNGLWRLDDLI